jgi:hypothetical protein
MTVDGFTYQYAIRLPDGTLFATHQGHEGCPALPVVFDELAAAQHALHHLRHQAVMFGVTDLAAFIEQRICSPFSVTDPGLDFAEQVTRWAARQGGTP